MSGKDRVLILVNHDVVIFNFRFELVERLIKEGYVVHISAPKGDHTDDLIKTGAVFHEVSFDRHGMNPIEEIRLLQYYRLIIRNIAPIAVFTYTIKCNIYGGMAARSFDVPFIPNITGLGTTVNDGSITKKTILFLYRIGIKRAKKVFFQNEANKEYFIYHNVLSSPYSVLPGSGVNLEKFSLTPYPDEKGGLIFSTIGRIMKDKGTEELLKAAEVIKTKYPKVTFRIIGFFDDEFEEKVKRAEREGTIEYIPQQVDIRPWIKESHAVIHPSHHEGMSNVLLEAAASGRPVIATCIPGCKEAFDEGISGIGFRPKDYREIVRAVQAFIELSHDEKICMGIAGRKKMEKQFNRDIVVDEYISELNKLKVRSAANNSSKEEC